MYATSLPEGTPSSGHSTYFVPNFIIILPESDLKPSLFGWETNRCRCYRTLQVLAAAHVIQKSVFILNLVNGESSEKILRNDAFQLSVNSLRLLSSTGAYGTDL